MMKVVSAVFHPLLMATYCCLLLWWKFPAFYSPVPAEAIGYLVLAILTTTFLIPTFCILLLLYTKKISNLELTDQKERSIPFLIIGFFYALTTYLFFEKIHISSGLISLMIIISGLILLISIISIRFKISVHSAAIWGMCGVFTVIILRYLEGTTMFFLLVLFLIAGLTSSSRLYLKRHTETEVWIGAFVGFFVCLLGAYMLF